MTTGANPADLYDINVYRAAYERDGKRVVARPGANRAAAHAALKRLAERYLPLALSTRNLHAPTLDDATVESEVWVLLGGCEGFDYDPDRATLAAWFRQAFRRNLLDISRLARTPGFEDELDEGTPTHDDEHEIFLELLLVIDLLTRDRADRELILAAVEARVIEPARHSSPPLPVAQLARECGVTEHVARRVVRDAEEIVRAAAAEIGILTRTYG